MSLELKYFVPVITLLLGWLLSEWSRNSKIRRDDTRLLSVAVQKYIFLFRYLEKISEDLSLKVAFMNNNLSDDQSCEELLVEIEGLKVDYSSKMKSDFLKEYQNFEEDVLNDFKRIDIDVAKILPLVSTIINEKLLAFEGIKDEIRGFDDKGFSRSAKFYSNSLKKINKILGVLRLLIGYMSFKISALYFVYLIYSYQRKKR